MRWKLTMSSSDNLASARSLRSGSRRTAGRPAGSMLPMSQPEPLMQITSTSSPSMSFIRVLTEVLPPPCSTSLGIGAEQTRGVGAHARSALTPLAA